MSEDARRVHVVHGSKQGGAGNSLSFSLVPTLLTLVRRRARNLTIAVRPHKGLGDFVGTGSLACKSRGVAGIAGFVRGDGE